MNKRQKTTTNILKTPLTTITLKHLSTHIIVLGIYIGSSRAECINHRRVSVPSSSHQGSLSALLQYFKLQANSHTYLLLACIIYLRHYHQHLSLRPGWLLGRTAELQPPSGHSQQQPSERSIRTIRRRKTATQYNHLLS